MPGGLRVGCRARGWAGRSSRRAGTRPRELEIKTVFTLTYVADFFEKCGYHRIDKADLPHKIWNECVRCPLFPNCNEVALIRSVAAEPLSAAAPTRSLRGSTGR